VDDDHIQGILELTSELRDAVNEHRPSFVQIQGLWHNSFDNIISHNTQPLTASVTASFGTASVNGTDDLSEATKAEIQDESDEQPEVVLSGLKVLASIAQGAQLREDARRLKLPLNTEFRGEIIVAKEDGKALDMGSGLTFKVVGPMLPEIDALRKK